MKMITAENIKSLSIQRNKLMDRLKKVDKVSNEDLYKGWFSRELMVPIGEMLGFNEEFDKSYRKTLAEEKEINDTEIDLKSLNNSYDRDNENIKRLTGFE